MTLKTNGQFVSETNKQKNDGGTKAKDSSENFEPPDGGWGWIIVMAAGFSNFCILPVLQSFGLLFRDRFAELGISSTQTTTILNINTAVTSCIGLANGPLFRVFSYRQISFVGALISAISITALSTMKSFTGVLIFFSIFLGLGVGVTMSSNSLALNTFFKKKRRLATGLSWTCTGMGPIVMPQIITLLIPIYGMEGTVLIFGAIAFNAVVCALLLQPVSWHAKRSQAADKLLNNENKKFEEAPVSAKGSKSVRLFKEMILTELVNKNDRDPFQSKSLENLHENKRDSFGALSLAKEKFGSQYLYYDDEEDGASGIDVIGPETPMMSRANDGWFSRKNTSTTSIMSKSSKVENSSRNPIKGQPINLSRQSSLSKGSSARNFNRQNSDTEKNRRKLSIYQSSTTPLNIVDESCEQAGFENCKGSNCNHKSEQKSLMLPEEVETDKLLQNEHLEEPRKKTFLEALVIFFDLDLLRDPIYVNIMLGITFANFTEMNFSLLTPFILSESGFSNIQIATVMSVLGGVDVITRLIIPFVADLIGWQNKTFFLVGICAIAAGRIVLAHVRDFGIIMAVAVLIGIGKALRTIFMALVIPSHVPLSRLPGATGIQLLASGIISLTLGPAVGWVRDITPNYALMLHCLNFFTYLTTITWGIEIYLTKGKSRKASEVKEASKKLTV